MMREEVEMCPHCMGENVAQWDVERDGYQIECQHCGEKIMLCDACYHSDDNPNQKCDWSCEGCFRNRVELCTFPDDDKNYCKHFEVSRDWLVGILESLDRFNENKGVDLENFLGNYVWDETWFIYELAKKNGKIISEEEVE